MMEGNDQLSSLLPVIFIFSVLLFTAIGWCALSSCLGRPILSFFGGLWEASVSSANIGGGRTSRRRQELGEYELWEMESRGRAGY